jgi:hypothetical protein
MSPTAVRRWCAVACRRCTTKRKISGRSPIGLTTTHGRAAALHGGKGGSFIHQVAPQQQLITSLIPHFLQIERHYSEVMAIVCAT